MKVLFFAPHAAIWVHSFPEALIAKALKDAGHDVIYISCGEAFSSNCVAMSAYQVHADSPTQDKARICGICKNNESLLRNSFDLPGKNISEYIDNEILAKVEGILAKVDKNNFQDFRINNLPLAKYAIYAISLKYKLMEMDLDDNQWAEFNTEFRYVLYTWFCGEKIIEEFAPDAVVTYNSLYPVNRTMSMLAEVKGVPSYFLHAGQNLKNRLQRMLLGRGTAYDFVDHLILNWPRFKDIPCTAEQISNITHHQLEKMSGESIFVYSTGISNSSQVRIREKFSIGSDQKILLATLSSYDERMAAEFVESRRPTTSELFQTQLEWVLWLIEYLKERPDLFLIIRLHPRDFPNRRDGVLSPQGKQLSNLLRDLPPNVGVNWPTDNISLYKLGCEIDVVLNGWSTAGEEMGILGIPVVLYSDNNTNYPSTLHKIGLSSNAYKAAIEEAIEEGWNFEHCRQAYRWKVFEMERSEIKIDEKYPRAYEKASDKSLIQTFLSKTESVFYRLFFRANPSVHERKDLARSKGKLKAMDEISSVFENKFSSVIETNSPRLFEQTTEELETIALKAALIDVRDIIFSNNDNYQDNVLYQRLSGNIALEGKSQFS